MVRLYHERWEIETAYYALRHTLLHGHVLRSGDQPGLEQETWALLTLYQLLRMAMVDAIEAQPGTDPDRASFTTALETARDQLTAAAGICPDDPAGQPGVIGRAVLATLLPARRPRYSARIVKCSTSRYHEQRRQPPPAPGRHHCDRHHRAHPAPRARCAWPRPVLRQGTTPRSATNPAAAHHRDHDQPAPARLERPRTRPAAWGSSPATCSPSSANGPSWASSPAPASAPTRSTRRSPASSTTAADLNYAALPAATALRAGLDAGA